MSETLSLPSATADYIDGHIWIGDNTRLRRVCLTRQEAFDLAAWIIDSLSHVCMFPSCEHDVIAKGYCWAHYMQDRRGKDLTPVRRRSRTHAAGGTQ